MKILNNNKGKILLGILILSIYVTYNVILKDLENKFLVFSDEY
jgi:hypothetical protein